MAALAHPKMAREKMHQTIQRINNDSLGMQHGGSDSLPRKFHRQKNFRSSSEVHPVSSLTWRNSDNRCSVLTFLTFEPNGHWRVVAVPVHYPDSKFFRSGPQVNIDSLHLVSPQPIKSVQPDRVKVTKGPALGGSYSPNSPTNRIITGSNVLPQSKNKAILAYKTKRKELSKEFSFKSAPSSELSSTISNSSSDIKPSTTSIDESNVDNVEKRSPRKKNRKKCRKGKKNQCQNGSSGPRLSVKDHPVGSVTGTCNKHNRADDALLSSPKTLEAPLLDIVDLKSEHMLEETIPVSKKSSENRSVGSFAKKLQPKDSADFICDRSKDMDHVQLHSCDNSHSQDDMPHVSVLDPVPVRPSSNHSSRRSEKESCRTNISQPPASSFRKSSYNCKTSPSYSLDSYNNANEISHCSQSNNSKDPYSAIPNRRNTPHKIFPRFSSVRRFVSVGNLQSRAGKEFTHSVWQKVQRNGTSGNDTSGDSKRAPASLQLDIPFEETAFLKRNCNDSEDAKQFKDADSGKWKTKSSTASNQECKLYSQSRSGAEITNSDGFLEVTALPKETSSISSGISDQSATPSVSRSPPPGEMTCNTHFDTKSQTIGYPSHSLLKVQFPEFVPNNVSNSVGQGQENGPLSEVSVQSNSSGSGVQKWIPTGMKNRGSTNSIDSSSVERSENATSESKVNTDSENVSKAGVVSVNQNSAGTIHLSCNSECGPQASMLVEQKSKHPECSSTDSGYLVVQETVPDKIAEAVNRAYSLQLESEAVEKASGCPLAEFERILHYSSPVIYLPTDLVCHMCSKDQFGGASLCGHEKPNVTLESLWNWYEDPGVYGLKVSGDDYENKKRLGEDWYSYTAYFVPYLSAVQLFKKCNSHSKDANNSISSSEVLDSSQFTEIPQRSANADHLPTSPELYPQPIMELENFQTEANHLSSLEPPSVSAKCVASLQSSTFSDDPELLFEYFESLQPQQRRPLYEKINELASSQYEGNGDPTSLKSVKLDDLHHKSWYSVAWYPIYRIPDDTFRAAFLTFHSLGHLKRGTARFGMKSVQDSIVCPVVGLQSYNAHGECWFNPKSSTPDHLKPSSPDMNHTRILKERLRTLEETALLMARAIVTKGNLSCVNRHPDYEFFCSRKRW